MYNKQRNGNGSESAGSTIPIGFPPSNSGTWVADGNVDVAGPFGDTTPHASSPRRVVKSLTKVKKSEGYDF